MYKNGLAKARARLEKAKSALATLETSKTFDEFESAWTDLLLALHSVYAILEQSAKATPQSRQWFGRKKHERRKDPLLAYFHQARNSDEHGIERVTQRLLEELKIGSPSGGMVHVQEATFDGRKIKIHIGEHSSPDTRVEVVPARIRLLPVTNSIYGDTFEPPQEHLGKPLPNRSIVALANLALSYHEGLLIEAEQFTA